MYRALMGTNTHRTEYVDYFANIAYGAYRECLYCCDLYKKTGVPLRPEQGPTGSADEGGLNNFGAALNWMFKTIKFNMAYGVLVGIAGAMGNDWPEDHPIPETIIADNAESWDEVKALIANTYDFVIENEEKSISVWSFDYLLHNGIMFGTGMMGANLANEQSVDNIRQRLKGIINI